MYIYITDEVRLDNLSENAYNIDIIPSDVREEQRWKEELGTHYSMHTILLCNVCMQYSCNCTIIHNESWNVLSTGDTLKGLSVRT